MTKLSYDSAYWENRYASNQTQWDIGYPSTPLVEYLDQLINKSLKILIPGCGNAYEAYDAFNKGFLNTYVIDIAKPPLDGFKEKFPDFPAEQLILGDFFELEDKFDLILEQTFFCALHPSERQAYCQKMTSLLKPQGKLVGVLFDDPLNDDRPPFGGNKEEYLKLFQRYFDIHKLETCYNSIKPRKGRELFISVSNK